MRIQPLSESTQFKWPDANHRFSVNDCVPEEGACVTVWHLGCGSAHFISGKFMFAGIGRVSEYTGVTFWQYSEQYATFEERIDNGKLCEAMLK